MLLVYEYETSYSLQDGYWSLRPRSVKVRRWAKRDEKTGRVKGITSYVSSICPLTVTSSYKSRCLNFMGRVSEKNELDYSSRNSSLILQKFKKFSRKPICCSLNVLMSSCIEFHITDPVNIAKFNQKHA